MNVYTQAIYRKNKTALFITVLCHILLSMSGIVCSIFLGEVINAITAADMGKLRGLAIFALAFIIGEAMVQTVTCFTLPRFVHQGLRGYKEEVFRRISEKGIGAFYQERTSRYVSALSNDVNVLEEKYLVKPIELIVLVLEFVLSLGCMMYYSWVMTLTIIGLCIPPALIAVIMGGGMTRREQEVSDSQEQFIARLKDLLGGFSIIKSFQAEEPVRRVFEEDDFDLEKKKEKRRRYEGFLQMASGTAGSIMQMGIFVIGAYLAIRGRIEAGTTLIFVNLCNFLINPIQQIPQIIAEKKAAGSLIDKLDDMVCEHVGHTGDPAPHPLHDEIRLDHVSFAYKEEMPVFQDLSARFEAGKSYCLVGSSGSGKTTLLNLLMGTFDQYQGNLTYDGKELRTLDTDSLYQLIGLVGQNVFLFDDTIEANLTLFQSFPEDQVQKAVQEAGLQEVIEERGREYRCGENGVHLSGGERQRIQIARSLLKGNSVLLFDEATSSLDKPTAAKIMQSVQALSGVTRILVTHNMNQEVLQGFDEILMLKDGCIAEQGSFDELMKKKGWFYSLYTVTV